ncbi:DUF4865 family protein [Herbaspirillum chlorophenolicum]|uniref:DUF4865 family protein n=1 Tax=Herbaspirillum chlorophenolicum TaxID=211589 RepID=A0ABW8F0D1_9BURK|nr:DUF4865 family protein [Herbaspirillum chlorophenolicum]
MIIAQYEHRLPADYDLDIIRHRAAARGGLWDDVPELYFKAFLLREAGKHGANAHSYSSLYLWRHEAAFTDFISSRFRSVIDSFGRPGIRTRFALDARKGQGSIARLAYRQEIDIAQDADLAEVLAAEAARNREAAIRPSVVAAAVGVDVNQWRITRVYLSEGELDLPGATAYQVLYLARPLLGELPG